MTIQVYRMAQKNKQKQSLDAKKNIWVMEKKWDAFTLKLKEKKIRAWDILESSIDAFLKK